MTKGKIKEAFLGGNTSLGFYSYYDYILRQEDATRIIILKGGPGVGKSTFLKKTAAEMLDRKYDVEYMHCSSDSSSLDGIVIPDLKIALLDGTSPHVVDPKTPGAVDEIINLGDFWNEEGILKHKADILKDIREIKRLYDRAYRYIKAAATLYEDTTSINSWAMNKTKLSAVAWKLIDELFSGRGVALKEGTLRKLFASAITPNGLINYLPTILNTKRVYALRGAQGTGTEIVLEKVLTAAIERGYDVEAYYCALFPTKLEHLVIPDLDVSFTTINQYHNADVKIHTEIDLDAELDTSILASYQEVLEYNKYGFDKLLNRAISVMMEAKDMHDRIEKYYIPNMDFEAIQMCWESTLARILQYAQVNT